VNALIGVTPFQGRAGQGFPLACVCDLQRFSKTHINVQGIMFALQQEIMPIKQDFSKT
jgi:hypothetical protein